MSVWRMANKLPNVIVSTDNHHKIGCQTASILPKTLYKTKIKVKAAGGIRSPQEFLALYDMGVERMGINAKSAVEIVEYFGLHFHQRVSTRNEITPHYKHDTQSGSKSVYS